LIGAEKTLQRGLPFLDLDGIIALKEDSVRERHKMDVLALGAIRDRSTP